MVKLRSVALEVLLSVYKTVYEKSRKYVLVHKTILGGRTGLVVRASDSGSGDPGSILGQVGVLFP